MDNYLLNYENLIKTIIYKFSIEEGGIGDLIKFYIYLLNLCINHNIKLYYYIENMNINKYLKLKYNNMYIELKHIQNPYYLHNICNLDNLIPHTSYIVQPYNLYNFNIYHNFPNFVSDIFYFTDEIKIYANNFLNENNIIHYISIHLRMGDKHIETEECFKKVHNDTRNYNEHNIYNFIEQNKDKNIIFFCDNKAYKQKIKNKYNFITITNGNIGHTSYKNTTELQTFNTIVEFYLLSNSDHIYKASHSGFSIMASKFNNIPISDI
jgi:hypothetical protein